MANIDSPFGFRPIPGPVASDGLVQFTVDNSATSAVMKGDCVTLAGSSIGGYATVKKAAASNLILGVVVGIEPSYSNLGLKYVKAAGGEDRKVWVNVNPHQVYEVQVNGTLAGTAVGLNADIDVTDTGDTSTGISGMQLSATTTTATQNFKILGFRDNPSNEFDSDGEANSIARVILSEAQLDNGALGV